MSVSKRDAWLIGVRYGLEREDCFVASLAFGDKLAAAFAERFPDRYLEPTADDVAVEKAVEQAESELGMLVPPELRHLVSDRLSVLAERAREEGPLPDEDGIDE